MEWVRALMRALRTSLVAGLAAWWLTVQNNPKWLFVVPVVSGAFKWLRDKFPDSGFLRYLPF